MTIWMLACSRQAYALMQRLRDALKRQQPETQIICKVKCKSMAQLSEQGNVGECVAEWFGKVDAMVFLCAAGIAVRSIAPCIQHKSTDPAVVVVDERGTFSIALLSGHAGGANALAERIADCLGAVPVITTATDRGERFAVDDFARRHQMTITDWKLAKEISVDILEGRKAGLVLELPFEGELPTELCLLEKKETFLPKADEGKALRKVIWISSRRLSAEEKKGAAVLQLIPKEIAVGVGCRRGTAKEQIAAAVSKCLQEEGVLPEAVFAVASIDLKKDEAGLSAYCKEKGLSLTTYPAEQLQQAQGAFSDSAFVKNVTGVSCVCERSAVLAAGGELLCRKKIYDGVTVALAYRKGSVLF